MLGYADAMRCIQLMAIVASLACNTHGAEPLFTTIDYSNRPAFAQESRIAGIALQHEVEENYAEALLYKRQLYELIKRRLGEGHWESLHLDYECQALRCYLSLNEFDRQALISASNKVLDWTNSFAACCTDSALAEMEKAASVIESHYGAGNAHLCTHYNRLAAAQIGCRHYAAAEKTAARSQALASEKYHIVSPEEVTACYLRSAAIQLDGRIDEANIADAMAIQKHKDLIENCLKSNGYDCNQFALDAEFAFAALIVRGAYSEASVVATMQTDSLCNVVGEKSMDIFRPLLNQAYSHYMNSNDQASMSATNRARAVLDAQTSLDEEYENEDVQCKLAAMYVILREYDTAEKVIEDLPARENARSRCTELGLRMRIVLGRRNFEEANRLSELFLSLAEMLKDSQDLHFAALKRRAETLSLLNKDEQAYAFATTAIEMIDNQSGDSLELVEPLELRHDILRKINRPDLADIDLKRAYSIQLKATGRHHPNAMRLESRLNPR